MMKLKKWLPILCAAVLLLTTSALADMQGAFSVSWGDLSAEDCTQIVIEEDAGVMAITLTEDAADLVLSEIVMEQTDIVTMKVIWTEDALPAGHVIALQAYSGEALPRFRLDCTDSSGQRESWYIEQSGRDGSLLLTDEDVLGSEPVLPAGLQDTLARSDELEAYLAGDHTQLEFNEAAKEYCELWEQQRISTWGGYAMSEAEQRWMDECADNAQELSTDYEGGSIQPMIHDVAVGEMTREHVLLLAGLSAPAGNHIFAAYEDENGCYPLFEVTKLHYGEDHRVTAVTGRWLQIAEQGECCAPSYASAPEIEYPLAQDFTADMVVSMYGNAMTNGPTDDLYRWYIDAYIGRDNYDGHELVFQRDLTEAEQMTVDPDFWFFNAQIELNAQGEIVYMDYVYVPWG